MHTLIAVLASVAAGVAMAAEGLLQQSAASSGPADEDSRTMLRRLVSSTQWWAGLGSAACAYGLQALALAFGPLSLVQPVIVSEMLFAIPFPRADRECAWAPERGSGWARSSPAWHWASGWPSPAKVIQWPRHPPRGLTPWPESG